MCSLLGLLLFVEGFSFSCDEGWAVDDGEGCCCDCDRDGERLCCGLQLLVVELLEAGCVFNFVVGSKDGDVGLRAQRVRGASLTGIPRSGLDSR